MHTVTLLPRDVTSYLIDLPAAGFSASEYFTNGLYCSGMFTKGLRCPGLLTEGLLCPGMLSPRLRTWRKPNAWLNEQQRKYRQFRVIRRAKYV